MQAIHKKNKEIETLRALAILLVMFRHTHYVMPVTINDYPAWLQGTWSGVDLFFIISGYVITTSLLPFYKAYTTGQLTAAQILKSFYVRRVLRLLPVCFVVLSLYIVGCLFFTSNQQIPNGFASISDVLTELPYVLLYVYNIFIPQLSSSVLGWHWSLSIEEQFYFVLPFLLFIIKKNKARLWVFISIVLLINLIVRPLYAGYVDTETLWPLFTTPSFLRFDLLFAGCALALFTLHINKKNKILFIIIGLMSTVLLATVGGIISNAHIFSYPIILICGCQLVYIAILQKNILPTGKALQWIGGRSYALYLLNIPVLQFCNEGFCKITGLGIKQSSFAQGFMLVIISCIISGILAEILYRLVEKPFITAGKTYSNRILRRA